MDWLFNNFIWNGTNLTIHQLLSRYAVKCSVFKTKHAILILTIAEWGFALMELWGSRSNCDGQDSLSPLFKPYILSVYFLRISLDIGPDAWAHMKPTPGLIKHFQWKHWGCFSLWVGLIRVCNCPIKLHFIQSVDLLNLYKPSTLSRLHHLDTIYYTVHDSGKVFEVLFYDKSAVFVSALPFIFTTWILIIFLWCVCPLDILYSFKTFVIHISL